MSKIAIIGGGPAGIACAITAKTFCNNCEIVIFDKKTALKTLLYTGGGRCNLAYSESDFKTLASFYPRGEKFLYSIFSQFGVNETTDFFSSIGIKTYAQKDKRIFPKTDSAEFVRKKLLDKASSLGIKIIENTEILDIEKMPNGYKLTFNNQIKTFDKVVISTGGRFKNIENTGFNFAKSFGHTVTDLKPALSSLKLKEKQISDLAGVSLKNINATIFHNDKKILDINDDLLFTHNGISGPLAYKISSYCAFVDYNHFNPLKLNLNLTGLDFDQCKEELIFRTADAPKRLICNLIATFVPKSLAKEITKLSKIDLNETSANLSKEKRNCLIKHLTEFELNISSTSPDGEIVTAGGVLLNEVNPKTMESKIAPGLYFCGEVLNIDGLTGGFNLQNCWSTGYIAGKSCGNS